MWDYFDQQFLFKLNNFTYWHQSLFCSGQKRSHCWWWMPQKVQWQHLMWLWGYQTAHQFPLPSGSEDPSFQPGNPPDAAPASHTVSVSSPSQSTWYAKVLTGKQVANYIWFGTASTNPTKILLPFFQHCVEILYCIILWGHIMSELPHWSWEF